MARPERRPTYALAGRMLALACGLMFTPALAAEVPQEVRQAVLQRDYARALADLQTLADAGDPDALYELGRLYERGLGTPRDPARALQAFRRAGELGVAEAAYLAGVMLEAGQGAPADAAAAMAWYRRAAAAGHTLARRRLHRQPAPAAPADLHAIVVGGEVGHLQELPSDVNVDAPDQHGRLAINLAAAAGDLAMVDGLLELDADPDLTDASGSTALHRAASSGALAVVRRLVEAGAAVDVPDAGGNTPLHLAAAGGHESLARWLLQQGANPTLANDSGWTARMLASRSDDTALRNVFGVAAERSGAGVAALADMQRTPAMAAWSELAIAAWSGRLELVRALVEGGADPAAVDASGFTPLGRALSADRFRVAEYLIARGVPVSPGREDVLLTHLVAARGPADLLRSLAANGADLERRDPAGRTPLLVAAAQARDPGAVAALLSLGASVDAADHDGLTVLHLLAPRDDVDAMAAAIRAGADVNGRDALGRTPLWLAAARGATAASRVLLRAGAQPDAAGDGTTPLHQAAAVADPDILAMLLAHGADPDAKTTTGSTPLLVAADRGRLEHVRLLLDAGSRVDARNAVGDTPLICAVRGGHRQVSRLLLEAGANPRQRNARHESARALARQHQDAAWNALFDADEGILGLLDG